MDESAPLACDLKERLTHSEDQRGLVPSIEMRSVVTSR